MIRIISLLFLFSFSTCRYAATSGEYVSPTKGPKNVILMIGDGMGISQITAGLFSNRNKLNLERCETVGLIKTYSSDNLVTDSAAGATAFATGKKTYNGAIGVGPLKRPLPTILELAEQDGMATGLVATSEITHATPASFIAHQPSRIQHQDIAVDFLQTEVDLFIGGGRNYFKERTDNRDLTYELKGLQYRVLDLNTPFDQIKLEDYENLAYFTADDAPTRKLKGRDYLPAAGDYAARTLRQRSEENGFFLMIEGSQIDWGGHANNADYIISEVLDFDETVGKILDFAQRDGETLVIITADHETGGFAINKGSKMAAGELKTGFTTGGHTAALVPVFAFGPGAEAFSGIYENTAIFDKMKAALGL
ncbi:MAG: alkaline phosphatase [Bacteroidota bacterium]